MPASVLPHDLDAEQAVLGCLLIDPGAISRVRDIVGPDDFYADRHGLIYQAAVGLADGSSVVDVLTLKGRLADSGDLERAGGLDYLAGLAQKIPTAVSAPHYARRVADLSERRRLVKAAESLARSARNGQWNRDSDLATMESVLVTSRRREILATPGDDPGFTVAELLQSTDDESQTWLPFLGHPGVIAEGWTHLVGGFGGVGKSPLFHNATVPWLNLGKDVLWISEEPRKVWRVTMDDLFAVYGDDVPWDHHRVILQHGKTAQTLLQEAGRCRFDVLVLDTLRRVCQPAKENDASEIRKAIDPWIALAIEHGATLIVLHHHRKLDGEHGERFAGSEQIMASFDIAMEYRFGTTENRRQLRGVRVRGGGALPDLTTVRDEETGQIIVAGVGGYVTTRDRDAAVLDALGDLERPVTIGQLHQHMGKDALAYNTLSRSLLRLARRRLILRSPPLSAGLKGGRPTWQAIDLFARD